MSYHLILPFFPEELRALLLDPSISDLMINGTTGVYADRAGVVQHIPLSEPYTNDRLQAAIERVARILGQDLTTQNPILNTRLPDGSRVAVVGAPSSINGPTLTIRKFNRWYSSDELIESGSMPRQVRDTFASRTRLIWRWSSRRPMSRVHAGSPLSLSVTTANRMAMPCATRRCVSSLDWREGRTLTPSTGETTTSE